MANDLEQIETETYTSVAQFHRDCGDLRYKTQPQYREACERKLKRSLPNLGPLPTGKVKVQRSMNVTRDASGKPVFTPGATDPDYIPETSSDEKALALANGRYQVLPGGAVRFTRKG